MAGAASTTSVYCRYMMSEYLRYNDNEELEKLVRTTSTRAPLSSISTGESIEAPSMKQTVDVIIDIQLHRYNGYNKRFDR
ncbi:hypothetical protein O9993_22065 [Vibrio lentus]|nr:hypothetical protein [Vibrio lentus]